MVPHENYINIFHLTTSEDYSDPGSRIPAVFFRNNMLSIKTSICDYLHQECTYSIYPEHTFETKIEMNGKHHYEIQLLPSYWCILIDDILMKCYDVLNPGSFEKVYLYISDPWKEHFGDYLELSDFSIEKFE